MPRRRNCGCVITLSISPHPAWENNWQAPTGRLSTRARYRRQSGERASRMATRRQSAASSSVSSSQPARSIHARISAVKFSSVLTLAPASLLPVFAGQTNVSLLLMPMLEEFRRFLGRETREMAQAESMLFREVGTGVVPAWRISSILPITGVTPRIRNAAPEPQCFGSRIHIHHNGQAAFSIMPDDFGDYRFRAAFPLRLICIAQT